MCSAVIPPTITPQRLAVQQLGVAADTASPSTARSSSAMVGATSSGSRAASTRAHRSRQRVGDRVELVGVAAVRDHRGGWACCAVSLGRHRSRRAARPRRGCGRALHREQHRRAEVHRDPRVEAEFARAGHVGVVAADDHDGVALLRHLVVPVDDLAERAVGIGVHLLVGDAEALLVATVGRACARAAARGCSRARRRVGRSAGTPPPRRRSPPALQDTERDGRLAGVALR